MNEALQSLYMYFNLIWASSEFFSISDLDRMCLFNIGCSYSERRNDIWSLFSSSVMIELRRYTQQFCI